MNHLSVSCSLCRFATLAFSRIFLRNEELMRYLRFGRLVFLGLRCLLAALVLLGSLSAAQAIDSEIIPEVQRIYAQARAAQAAGQIHVAIEKYREILKLAPHLAAACNNLGLRYFNRHDYVHAAAVLDHGIKLDATKATTSIAAHRFKNGITICRQ